MALDYLIDMKLVAKKAAADKMDADAAFTRRMAYYHDKLAMEALLTDVAAKAATDEAEHKAYDEAAKAQPPVPEVSCAPYPAAHRGRAKAALARVKKGEDFAKVATELSKDPGGEGGDLGWFTRTRWCRNSPTRRSRWSPARFSDPVKSQFGWHIIKVEEKRMKTFPSFDQVKDQAARYVVQKAQSDLIQQLRQNVKIERTEPEPKPADPAGGRPAPLRTRKSRKASLAANEAPRLVRGPSLQFSEDKVMAAPAPLSPLAPKKYPVLPPIDGVRFATAAAGVRYAAAPT